MAAGDRGKGGVTRSKRGSGRGFTGEASPDERQDWPGLQPKQAAMLSALVVTGGQVVAAARAAKVSKSQHYHWLKEDQAYAEAHEHAKIQGADVLESEAIRRAKEGVYEPVFYKGRQCGKVLRYPDGLMQFLLRGAIPSKYREKVEHTGADGSALIPQKIEVVFVKPDAGPVPE